jgi:hypothetical protein
MLRVSQVVVGLVWAVYTAGCRPARESELPGKYVAKTDWGESTLALKNDHTSEEVMTTKEGTVEKVNGTWELKDGRIILKPCLLINHSPPAGKADFCDYSVEGFGVTGVEIALDPDAGIAYRK